MGERELLPGRFLGTLDTLRRGGRRAVVLFIASVLYACMYVRVSPNLERPGRHRIEPHGAAAFVFVLCLRLVALRERDRRNRYRRIFQRFSP